MKRRVFTKAYRPFLFGPPHTPIAAEVEVIGPYEVGSGFSVYLARSPLDGRTYAAEAETGAFVGDSVETVKADIKEAEKSVMDSQMVMAREMAKQATLHSADEFWSMLSKAKR